MKFYTPLYKTFFIAGILALFLTASAQTDTAAGTVTVQSSKKTMEVHCQEYTTDEKYAK